MIPREPFMTGGWCIAIGISATSVGSFLVERFSRLLSGTETARWHPFESFGVDHCWSDLVYSADACQLYRIDTARLTANRGK